MKLLFGLFIVFVLFIDQFLKIYIKTHFSLYTGFNLFDNLISVIFIENPGIACFNFLFLDFYSKIFLSLLRLFFVIFLVYKFSIIKTKNVFFCLSLSLLIAGALGNLLDNMFYGLIFNKGIKYSFTLNKWVGYKGIANLDNYGYTYFMCGSVVDMIAFNFKFKILSYIITSRFICNVADISICLGLLLCFLT